MSSAEKLKETDRIKYEQAIYEFETLPDKDSDYNKIEVPDGGYGWVVVFSSFLLNFCTSGASYGYGVYLSYYMDSGKYETGGKLDYAAIGGLSFGVGLLFSPLYNYILLRTSPKKLAYCVRNCYSECCCPTSCFFHQIMAGLSDSRRIHLGRHRCDMFSKHYNSSSMVSKKKIPCFRDYRGWNRCGRNSFQLFHPAYY